MFKNKLIVLGLLAAMSLSSCGIFHKGCGCPTFGALRPDTKALSKVAEPLKSA